MVELGGCQFGFLLFLILVLLQFVGAQEHDN
jgi:hypothetical protein